MVTLSFTIYSFLFILSGLGFVVGLYTSTPKINIKKSTCTSIDNKYIIRVGLFILFCKIFIWILVSGEIPLFLEDGSNAYIIFDSNNKILSSVLLGFGSADLVLIGFSIPILKTDRSRAILLLLLLVSIIIAVGGGKKAALISAFLAIALSEYLRLVFVKNQKLFFLTMKNIIIGAIFSISWFIWIYFRTESMYLIELNLSSIDEVFNFVLYQFANPHILFVSGELIQFFNQYQVNKITYAFHSILSPLGFPAFHASIGPALHEYQTGNLSGHGTNPTFILEGYVLFGYLMPIYAVILGVITGRARLLLMTVDKIHYKIVLNSLLLPTIYIASIDLLLFLKMSYVIVAGSIVAYTVICLYRLLVVNINNKLVK
jgi:hypothetical protein